MKFYALNRDKKYTPVNLAKDNEWEIIRCPVYEGHRRAGKRISELIVKVTSKKERDFYWTYYNDCLITNRLAQLFKQAGFTGYKLKPVQVVNNRDLISKRRV